MSQPMLLQSMGERISGLHKHKHEQIRSLKPNRQRINVERELKKQLQYSSNHGSKHQIMFTVRKASTNKHTHK